MNDNLVHLLIFLFSASFSAGVAWGFVRGYGRDLTNVGRKVNGDREDAARRYHNLSLAILIAAPPSKESEISRLLKE